MRLYYFIIFGTNPDELQDNVNAFIEAEAYPWEPTGNPVFGTDGRWMQAMKRIPE